MNLKQIREKYLKPFSSKKKSMKSKSSKHLTHDQKHLKPGFKHYSCSDPSIESDQYFNEENMEDAKYKLKHECNKVLHNDCNESDEDEFSELFD